MTNLEGYKKVAENGGTFVTGLFWNPETGKTKLVVERDYDYEDGSRDNDEAYYMPIDKEAQRAYQHSIGELFVGDTVEVYKGRKIPVGTVAKIERIYDWKDCYGRVQATYAVFTDGRKTSIYNCRLVSEG